MPDIDTMKTSNYLKKEDVGAGVLVTIKTMVQENMAKDGMPQELKWMIYFNEFQKPLVSNVTHREQIAAYIGSRNSDDWSGKQVVLWNDPSVVFQGKVGAIRIRPAQLAQSAGGAPQPQAGAALGQQQHNPGLNQYDQTNHGNPTAFVDDDIPGFD